MAGERGDLQFAVKSLQSALRLANERQFAVTEIQKEYLKFLKQELKIRSVWVSVRYSLVVVVPVVPYL